MGNYALKEEEAPNRLTLDPVFLRRALRHEKGPFRGRFLPLSPYLALVAGEGFEPPTLGL